jgi:CheY-like chemotaxis protein
MRKILFVEDEDILRETFSLLMSTQPYSVDIAENGQAALEFCADTTYDLILLDLMMPVLDGVGFLQQFMTDKPERTKVIVMSNLSSGQELDEAMKLGAERNLLKASLSPREILAAIKYELEAI